MRQDGVRPEGSRSWFHSNDIFAILGFDPNETYVPLARLCARLGLERGAQERRARRHAVLAGGLRKLRVEVGEREELALCLRVELLPLWLTTLEADQVAPELRAKLALYQRECASLLWQSFRPQGSTVADELLPQRHEQVGAEQAYVTAAAIATLARHQMLIERQLNEARSGRDDQGADPWAATSEALDDPSAARLAQTVRRVATTASERSRRNEYYGIYTGLQRQFGISSYRKMPPGRLYEALEWLERWHGDLLGEPEPPPDI